jgi:hypothetical protein
MILIHYDFWTLSNPNGVQFLKYQYYHSASYQAHRLRFTPTSSYRQFPVNPSESRNLTSGVANYFLFRYLLLPYIKHLVHYL